MHEIVADSDIPIIMIDERENETELNKPFILIDTHRPMKLEELQIRLSELRREKEEHRSGLKPPSLFHTGSTRRYRKETDSE